jgi:peroxiredoxin Q/BCP
MLKPGTKAPDFSLTNQRGEVVNLNQFLGKKVVVYFYPKDDTPGCTQEACDFRDHGHEFESLNAVILGISKDTEPSHARFANTYRLPFSILSDPDLKAIKAYGVWQKKTMMGKTGWGIVRTTFVIDEKGMIQKMYEKVKVADHVAEVLRDIKKELAS